MSCIIFLLSTRDSGKFPVTYLLVTSRHFAGCPGRICGSNGSYDRTPSMVLVTSRSWWIIWQNALLELGACNKNVVWIYAHDKTAEKLTTKRVAVSMIQHCPRENDAITSGARSEKRSSFLTLALMGRVVENLPSGFSKIAKKRQRVAPPFLAYLISHPFHTFPEFFSPGHLMSGHQVRSSDPSS